MMRAMPLHAALEVPKVADDHHASCADRGWIEKENAWRFTPLTLTVAI
jgi:hypothetical protein